MNGAGEEALQIRERRLQPPDLLCRHLGLARGHQPGFERQVETAAQLRRGLARERDGRHVLDLVDAGSATPAAMRSASICVLPEPAPAFDEDVGQQLLADRRGATPGRSRASQSWAASLLNASPFASASLTSAWAFALPPHAATKSQYLQSSSSGGPGERAR